MFGTPTLSKFFNIFTKFWSSKDVKNIIDPKKEGFSKANVYKVVKILKGGK